MPVEMEGSAEDTPSPASFRREAWASRRRRHLGKVHTGRQGPLPCPETTPATALQGCPCPRMTGSVQWPRPQVLTLQEELVDEGEPRAHQPAPELRQGLGQLQEALLLLPAGAH